VHARVISVEQVIYQQYMSTLPSPTLLVRIDMDPLKGEALFEMNMALTFTIIDRLLGGTGAAPDLNRELSEIEMALMEGVIEKVLQHLREAWSPIQEVKARLVNVEFNPQFTQLVPPHDMVIIVVMGVTIGEKEDKVSLCIPVVVLEPLAHKLSAQQRYASEHRVTEEDRIIMRKRANFLYMPVVCQLGEVSLSLREIMQLQVGDVIKLGTRINDELLLKVGDRPKFFCKPGSWMGKVAVQISRFIETEPILEKEVREGA
jgi:flagellar motor switch protein FliM